MGQCTGHGSRQKVSRPMLVSSQLKLTIAALICTVFHTISPANDYARNEAGYASSRQDSPEAKSQLAASSPDKNKSAPRCEITMGEEITISCDYTPSVRNESELKPAARIVLNHATLSFKLHDESYMLVELEFTNEGQSSMSFTPEVFLAIDNDKGGNVVRRVLGHVNLANLRAGQRATFSERFLVGAFPGGNYTISISIPDPDPARKNLPAYNMLLASAGVPDPRTGLNTVAHFSVAKAMHSSREK